MKKIPLAIPRAEKTTEVALQSKKQVMITPETQAVLEKQVKDCMQVLNTYGKKDFDYLPVLKVFMERLGHYESEQLNAAFDKYIRNRSEFPTPSDIINVIENKPKLDQAVYNNLLKKSRDGGFLSDSEYDYIYHYEEKTINEWN